MGRKRAEGTRSFDWGCGGAVREIAGTTPITAVSLLILAAAGDFLGACGVAKTRKA